MPISSYHETQWSMTDKNSNRTLTNNTDKHPKSLSHLHSLKIFQTPKKRIALLIKEHRKVCRQVKSLIQNINQYSDEPKLRIHKIS